MPNDDVYLTTKIAWAYLHEIPDYYARLEKMEKGAEALKITIENIFMTTSDKINPHIWVYWFALMLVFVILGGYGRQEVEWILMKLYEFCIEGNPMQL